VSILAFAIGCLIGGISTVVLAATMRRDSTMSTHRAAMDALAKTATPRNLK